MPVSITTVRTRPPATVDRSSAGRSARWPAVIWALLACTFVVRAAGFALPFLSFRASELGLSTSTAGRIVAAFGAGWFAGQLLCGWLSDRLGRRTTLIGALLLASITLPVLAEVRTAPALFAAAAVVGMVYDAPRPIVSAVIATTMPNEAARTTVNAARHFSVNIAAGLTGAVGGLLAHRVGVSWLFWANAAACATGGLIAWRFMKPTRTNAHPATGERPRFRAALADRRLWLLWLASLCAMTCAAGMFSSLPLLMAAQGLDAAAYGCTQVATAAAVIAVTPLLTPWLSRRAAREVPMTGPLAASSLLLGAGMGAAGLAATTTGYSFVAVCSVPGEVILFIAASNLVDRISPPGARGSYAGIWSSTLAVAVIAAPTLTAWSLSTGGELLAGASILAAGGIGAALCIPLRALINASLRVTHSPSNSRPCLHDAPAPYGSSRP
ncbi:MFS transporter [Streptomyces sp. NPDC020681]|uniref:MFS transporter n=1 Tax=Streptomyces sp. NPDC020681 TaxID=3365083 RepID=UPI0037985D33